MHHAPCGDPEKIAANDSGVIPPGLFNFRMITWTNLKDPNPPEGPQDGTVTPVVVDHVSQMASVDQMDLSRRTWHPGAWHSGSLFPPPDKNRIDSSASSKSYALTGAMTPSPCPNERSGESASSDHPRAGGIWRDRTSVFHWGPSKSQLGLRRLKASAVARLT